MKRFIATLLMLNLCPSHIVQAMDKPDSLTGFILHKWGSHTRKVPWVRSRVANTDKLPQGLKQGADLANVLRGCFCISATLDASYFVNYQRLQASIFPLVLCGLFSRSCFYSVFGQVISSSSLTYSLCFTVLFKKKNFF